MVLLILALLWAVVLVPPAVRSRSEGRKGRSIRTFRRRLARLAPPVAVRPANATRPTGATRAHVAVIADPSSQVITPPMTAKPPAKPALGVVLAGPRREVLQRRRRRRLAALLVAMAASLVLGAVPALRFLWPVHVVLDAYFAAYALRLRHLHRRRGERTAQVHYLPAPDAHEDGVAVEVPLRREALS